MKKCSQIELQRNDKIPSPQRESVEPITFDLRAFLHFFTLSESPFHFTSESVSSIHLEFPNTSNFVKKNKKYSATRPYFQLSSRCWKSDETLSLVLLFDRLHQTLETVFHPISRHLEFRQKYSALRVVLSILFSVFGTRMKHLSLVFDYYCSQRSQCVARVGKALWERDSH